MKKPMILSMTALSILSLLCSCNPTPNPTYIAKQLPVYGYSMEKLEDANCRYYDEYPNIPFMDINSYTKYLLNKETTISKVSKDVYLINTFKGSATIDVKNDVLHSDDYNEFINTTIYRDETAHNVYYDGSKFIKPSTRNVEDEVTAKTINFKDYKIDFIYDDGKLWAPFITYSDMFKGVTMIQGFCDGKNIYFSDSNKLDMTQCYLTWNYYINFADVYYKNGVRDPKTAEHTYYELCFSIDNYFGYPGRSPIEELMKEHGLDYALQNYSDSTRITREYLLSTSVAKYVAGMIFLGNLLDDGGHTVINQGVDWLCYTKVMGESFTSEVQRLIIRSGYEEIPSTSYDGRSIFRPARENSEIQNQVFYSKGDTFIYSFDQFDINFDQWDAFYAGETDELPNDTVGNFHRGIRMAQENPAIKNFVLDISINGGGFGDVVVYLMGAMANAPYICYYDFIDQRNVKQDYLCDINLDGKFDELDNQKIADFNFAILTSGISFSCGNLLPADAKDNEIPLLGGKTGGGACAVLDNCTMEGVYYRTSSFVQLSNANFENIDQGIDVDYDLTVKDGEFNIDNFYNVDLISSYINEFYSL